MREQVALTSVITTAQATFGALRGLFHLAMDRRSRSGEAGPARLDSNDLVVRIRNNSQEIQTLSNVLRGLALQFVVVFSGNSSIQGGVGLSVPAAASAALDSEVVALNSTATFPWYLVNWDERLTDVAPDDGGSWTSPAAGSQCALTASEALAALWLTVCSWPATQVIVSAVPLQSRLVLGNRRPSGNGQVALERNSGIAFDGEAAPAESARYVAPRTELERTVLGFWKDVLGGEDIGVEDHFLERGGDSLIALRIIARVKDRFGVSVPPASFIGSKGTIAGVVREIATLMAMGHDSCVVEEMLATVAGSQA
jgi:acyl carrier protein